MRSLRQQDDGSRSDSLVGRGLCVILPVLMSLAVLIVMNGGGRDVAADDPVTLNGSWAPFTRCPVDDPTMLAVEGPAQTSYCIAVNSAGGSIKLGNTESETGPSSVQFGIAGPAGATQYAIIAPPGGAIIAAPVDVPGGLLGLMCPSTDLAVLAVCNLITTNELNAVTATVQQAGSPSDFNLAAGLGTGIPVLTLPIKVKLDNPLLGANCYIGSEADPILLRPSNLSTPVLQIQRFETDGTPSGTGPLQLLGSTGGSQGDSTFAVPAASGCGLAGALDTAVNSKVGLPSPSGNNSIVLSDGSTSTARFYPPLANSGRLLSDAWHSAICNVSCAASATPSPTPAPQPECKIARADIDGDGAVSILDLSRAAQAFGLAIPPADPRINQDADNVISILDLSMQASVFGQHVSTCP